jgi:cytochrome b
MSAGPRSEPEAAEPIQVWDLPVRVTHWLIAALFFFSWWSAENDQLEWHMLSGYATLTLVLFRLYWGLIGSSTARFAAFVRGPGAVTRYASRLFVRGERGSAGHNPMGGWSAIAMLGFLLLQTILGLFAVDVDGINSGPLDYLVSFDTGRMVAHWHGAVFNVLLGLVGLHLAAIAFYAIFRRENLVVSMLTGRKRLPAAAIQGGLRLRSPWLALPGLAVAALIVAAIVLGLYR